MRGHVACMCPEPMVWLDPFQVYVMFSPHHKVAVVFLTDSYLHLYLMVVLMCFVQRKCPISCSFQTELSIISSFSQMQTSLAEGAFYFTKPSPQQSQDTMPSGVAPKKGMSGWRLGPLSRMTKFSCVSFMRSQYCCRAVSSWSHPRCVALLWNDFQDSKCPSQGWHWAVTTEYDTLALVLKQSHAHFGNWTIACQPTVSESPVQQFRLAAVTLLYCRLQSGSAEAVPHGPCWNMPHLPDQWEWWGTLLTGILEQRRLHTLESRQE